MIETALIIIRAMFGNQTTMPKTRPPAGVPITGNRPSDFRGKYDLKVTPKLPVGSKAKETLVTTGPTVFKGTVTTKRPTNLFQLR